MLSTEELSTVMDQPLVELQRTELRMAMRGKVPAQKLLLGLQKVPGQPLLLELERQKAVELVQQTERVQLLVVLQSHG